jgi:hypothetical protein
VVVCEGGVQVWCSVSLCAQTVGAGKLDLQLLPARAHLFHASRLRVWSLAVIPQVL